MTKNQILILQKLLRLLSELLEKIQKINILKLNDFRDKSCYDFDELILPKLVSNNELRKNLSNREVPSSPIVRDFLMRNWSEKRFDMNRKSKEPNMFI